MKVLTGHLFLGKIDHSKVMKDDQGRDFIEVVVIVNDHEGQDNKAGVIQQNTVKGERRLYLSNLFSNRKKLMKKERRKLAKQDKSGSGSGKLRGKCFEKYSDY